MSKKNGSVARHPLAIVALCLTIVAMLWAALIFDVDRSGNATMEQARHDVQNLALAFKEDVARTMSAIDQLLIIMTTQINAAKDARVPLWVKDSALLQGMSVQVSLIGSDGIMLDSTTGITDRIDLSDRAHFRHHLDPSASQPYISVPVIGRASGKWSIQVTRRVTRKDGSFGGVVVVSIDPLYFSKFFDKVDLGQNGVVALVGLDGIVRARRGPRGFDIGQNVGDTRLFERISNSNAGTFMAQGRLDGVARVYGYSSVPGYPLMVAVGVAMDGAHASSNQVWTSHVAIGGALTFIIVAFSWFLGRETRQRWQRELTAQHEESFRMLFETNPMPMLVLDCEDLKFLAVNDAAVRHYGYAREQFIAMTKLDLLPSEDRGRFIGLFRDFRQSGQDEFQSDLIRRHRKADGSVILVHVYGQRLTYHDRPALSCSIIDVTDRVRAEEERDRNRDFLDRIIDNIPVTVFVKDARSLQYILVNRAGEKLWGLPREKLVGKTPHEIFDKETADIIVENDRQMLRSNSDLHVREHSIKTPRNGERLVTSNRICVRDQNGEVQYLLVVTDDITERKGVEEQLRQAQKMEAVGNLTGGVAHDFNNLLTIIIGNLDLLLEDIAGNQEAEQKVETILQASERGADLARLMLAFSRRQPLQSKPVDVNSLIRGTTRLLNRTLGEDISIEVKAGGDLARALVDESQLETALLNIAINARDAMPEGGTLAITTRNSGLDADYVAHHPGVVPGAYVEIEIADTGRGMTPDVVEHIFEPFFTTKGVGKGTGLGLSMVYGFMKQSSGHISVYSEVGQGTVFKLFLPLAPAAESHADPLPPAREQTARHSGEAVILAVDDNPDVRATVVVQLKGLGYRVREADNARSALEILDSTDRIDLLFTDVVMPGSLNGKELASQARIKRPDLKVLFTSGFPGTATGPGTKFDDADVLLSKPYRKRDLAKAVEAMLTAQP